MRFGVIKDPLTAAELISVRQKINAFVENKEWESAYDTVQKIVYEQGAQLNSFLFVVDQIDSISTALLEDTNSANNLVEQKFINLLGVISFYLDERKDSLNFYVLGLLKENSGDENKYLQNIGTALMLLGEYESAIKYLRQAVNYLNKIEDPKDKVYKQTLYRLNLAQALVKNDDFKEAILCLEDIDESQLNSAMNNRKELLSTICEIRELNFDTKKTISRN